MKKPLILTVDNFTTFQLEGLSRSEISHIQSKTALPVKGAFMTAAYKAKIWDGKESLFTEDGVGFVYELETILNILESDLGYDLDYDLDYKFDQPWFDFDAIPLVGDGYLKEFTGFDLRDYQLNGINSVIQNRKGVLDYGTNAGKSWICAGISKAFDPILKSVVIVPSENLVTQTFADYDKTDLNVVALTANIKPAKRKETIQNARHVIITSKLFMNCFEYFTEEPMVLIIDETHLMGTVFSDIIRNHMAHCPVRVGLTATLPNAKTDPFKRKMIFSHLGGGVLEQIKQKELISRGVSSQLSIQMFKTRHQEIEELSTTREFDWSLEDNYLLNNTDRIAAIAEFIKEFDNKNTLILCHAGLGVKLAEMLGTGVVIDETKTEQRQAWFNEFDNRDDFKLVATFGCAGTGLSINRIFRLFMIDVGKNETYILQGIGRGLRRDGEVNKIEVIDISADSKYSKRHRKDRIAIYKREKFNFVEESRQIIV